MLNVQLMFSLLGDYTADLDPEEEFIFILMNRIPY